MVYYTTLDGEEHEFEYNWQVFEFMNFHKLANLSVVFIRENGKAVKYNAYDNGKDRVFPVVDEFGQQVVDKNRKPIRKLVERWRLCPVRV